MTQNNTFRNLFSTFFPPLLFISAVDLFFIFLVWLANPFAIYTLTPVILLFSLVLLSSIYLFIHYRQKQKILALQQFLDDPDSKQILSVLEIQDAALRPVLHTLLHKLTDLERERDDSRAELFQYQDFIEEWVHNIKTPMSLATLVLENHKDEMSSYVFRRMNHVHREIRTDTDMILYYARLGTAHVEYRFESVPLSGLVEDVLADYREMLSETAVTLTTRGLDVAVISDRKVLRFMLSQLLNNALQYTTDEKKTFGTDLSHDRESGHIEICAWTENLTDGTKSDAKTTSPVSPSAAAPSGTSVTHLAVRDNGRGIPAEDIPFLFDKGFTGNHPDRRNATGMGLYLVAKYADALGMSVQIEEQTYRGEGFGIELRWK